MDMATPPPDAESANNLYLVLGPTGLCGVLIAWLSYLRKKVEIRHERERSNGEGLKVGIGKAIAADGPEPVVTALSLLTAAVTDCTVEIKKIVAYNAGREQTDQLKRTVMEILKEREERTHQ
jgi:hypothetical protein